MSDYYELLQVPRHADFRTIKAAYRRLARLYHPDSNKSHIAAEHMKLLNAAYDTLSDPLKRRHYDERLEMEAQYGVAHDVFDPYAAAPRARPSAVRPWLVWIGITALLIVAALIGTLFALRNQLPSLVALIVPTPTRTILGAATPTRTPLPTWTPTLVTSATATPTPTVLPSATPSSTPTATAVPPTPTPLPVVPPVQSYPLPVGARLARSEVDGVNRLGDIFVSSADGSNKFNLTRSESRNEQSPSWSPQGQSLVFAEFNSGALFTLSADGTQLTSLTAGGEVRDSSPVWSPAGALIAFSSIARTDFVNGLSEKAKVFVVDAGTRQRRLIADLPGRDLTWSPDGKWLAFRVPTGGSQTLYIATNDGRSFFYYQTGLATLRRLAWTTDSRQVVYEVVVREQSEVYVTALQPLSAQRLAGSVSVVSPRGRFPGPPADGEYFPPIVSTVR